MVIATGYMDETVRRLTEGPKFSDLGQIEGKLLNSGVFETVQGLEQSNHVLSAWTMAVSEFARSLAKRTATGKPFGSRSEIVSLGRQIVTSPRRVRPYSKRSLCCTVRALNFLNRSSAIFTMRFFAARGLRSMT
jgi:hypothetical protein